jgi:hypothetical protein
VSKLPVEGGYVFIPPVFSVVEEIPVFHGSLEKVDLLFLGFEVRRIVVDV